MGKNHKLDEKIREYILKTKALFEVIWFKRKEFFIINSCIAVITVLVLLFLVDPYFKTTIEILPSYGGKESSISNLGGFAALVGLDLSKGTKTEIYRNLIVKKLRGTK